MGKLIRIFVLVVFACFFGTAYAESKITKLSDEIICDKATDDEDTWSTDTDLIEFVIEAKRRGLACGTKQEIAKRYNNAAANSECDASAYEVADQFGNYYTPDEAVDFGRKIQNLLRNKDLASLYEYIDESDAEVPRKKYALSKTFDEIFPSDLTSILDAKPPCKITFGGWGQGFHLGDGGRGRGGIWYDKYKNGWRIEKLDVAVDPEKFIHGDDWIVNGSQLHPKCFTKEWPSSDNFESFEEVYKIPLNDCWFGGSNNELKFCQSDKFRGNPGLYFGKEIKDFNPILPTWCSATDLDNCKPISLIQSIKACNAEAGKLTSNGGFVVHQYTDGPFQEEYSYYTLKPVQLDTCASLAPSIGRDCLSSYLVRVGSWGGGSMGRKWRTGIYGVFDLPDIGPSVVPLKYFGNTNRALDFLDQPNAQYQYEKFDYFGIEVRMYEVEACGSTSDILSQGNGYLCYKLPSGKNNPSPTAHGCLKRIIYKTGRGAMVRVGFWFDKSQSEQGHHITLYGDGEASVGTILNYNDKGFIELDREAFRQNPAPEFVTACRLSRPLFKP